MKLSSLLTEDLITLHLQSTDKDAAMNELAQLLDQAGVLSSVDGYLEALHQREKQGSTGIGFGIAIPHGKSDAVKEPRVAFGRTSGIDWDSLDGEPAQLIFMIAVPAEQAGDEHLRILQALSRKLIDDEFREALLAADSKEKVIQLLHAV
nr:fructose PTS transporter subunit IIA [Risungbinella massiliensis]